MGRRKRSGKFGFLFKDNFKYIYRNHNNVKIHFFNLHIIKDLSQILAKTTKFNFNCHLELNGSMLPIDHLFHMLVPKTTLERGLHYFISHGIKFYGSVFSWTIQIIRGKLLELYSILTK